MGLGLSLWVCSFVLQSEHHRSVQVELCHPAIFSSRGHLGFVSPLRCCANFKCLPVSAEHPARVLTGCIVHPGGHRRDCVDTPAPTRPNGLFCSCRPHVSGTSSPCRVSVPLLKTLDQMLAHGCFDAFTTDDE